MLAVGDAWRSPELCRRRCFDGGADDGIAVLLRPGVRSERGRKREIG